MQTKKESETAARTETEIEMTASNETIINYQSEIAST